MGVEALGVPDEAPDAPDRLDPSGAAPPQDRRNPHPPGGAGRRLRPRGARVTDLVGVRVDPHPLSPSQ